MSTRTEAYPAPLLSVSWQELALCRGLDVRIFFPERDESPDPAKRICAECPVILDCLRYALMRDEPYGIWGGLTEQERNRLRAADVTFEEETLRGDLRVCEPRSSAVNW